MCNLINTYIQVSLIPPREDQCEWHRMTRMTGPDCVVMCNLINTYIHTYKHIYIHIYIYIHTGVVVIASMRYVCLAITFRRLGIKQVLYNGCQPCSLRIPIAVVS